MVDLATTQRATLRIDEVQEILGKSRRTLYYWIARGKLPVVRDLCGMRIPTTAVRRLAYHTYGVIPTSVQSTAKLA